MITYEGWKSLKAKTKTKVKLEDNKYAHVEREMYKASTGDVDYMGAYDFEDTLSLVAESDRLQALIDDINELIADVQKELDKIA